MSVQTYLLAVGIIGCCLLNACTSLGEADVKIPLPDQPASRTVVLDDRLIHYYDWGSPAAQTVLVCIHGWAGGGIDFYALSRSLAALSSDVRIIALDLPGAGFSERPAESLGMDGYSRFVALWFDFVRTTLAPGEETYFVPLAHSMGGHILLRSFWRYRFSEATQNEDPGLQSVFKGFDRMVLMAPDGLRGEEGLLMAFRNRAIIRKFGPLMSPELLRENSRNVYFSPANCPSVVETLSNAAFQYQDGFASLADITLDTLGAQALDGQLQNFEIPVLLFWGKEDKVLRFRWSQVFANELPQVTFLALESCGHALQTDQADLVAQHVLEFADRP